MIRRAFIMRLKPGSLAEYKRRHDALWPELAAKLRECGVYKFATFESEPTLFLYSEIEDEGAWDRVWESEIHREWAKLMDPLMDMEPDGKPAAKIMPQVFNFEA